MRTAFIEALARNGVVVNAPAVAENPTELLPARGGYTPGTRVASFVSPPYAQFARLILKVSLNLGANLSLSLFGLDRGERTIHGALAAEREALIDGFGLDGDQFDFPTNGSGTPDSRAAPRALVDLLVGMHETDVAEVYLDALPILGVDGSLATTGADLPAKGHVFAKTGTTIAPGEDGETLELKAQNLAGYIETRSGRLVAYALMVNDAGALEDFEADISGVIADEARISSVIYETL
jgi:D-alanyl-D-alanine carboxypeptidase/D-alanyl-D-alanine-endopeptidase (penicillin-binding protein 4)